MIEIFSAQPRHLDDLQANLRTEDRKEIERLGMTPAKALWRSYKASMWTKAAYVDGEIAAVWGLEGVVLGSAGTPWLFTSPAIDANIMSFVLMYRQEVKTMLEIFPFLENWVDAEYTKSVKLLKIMGFTLDDPAPIPWIRSKAPFRRFWIRRP